MRRSITTLQRAGKRAFTRAQQRPQAGMRGHRTRPLNQRVTELAPGPLSACRRQFAVFRAARDDGRAQTTKRLLFALAPLQAYNIPRPGGGLTLRPGMESGVCVHNNNNNNNKNCPDPEKRLRPLYFSPVAVRRGKTSLPNDSLRSPCVPGRQSAYGIGRLRGDIAGASAVVYW